MKKHIILILTVSLIAITSVINSQSDKHCASDKKATLSTFTATPKTLQKDSAYSWQIYQVVMDNIMDPLGECGKLESSLGFIDKSGHRNRIFVDRLNLTYKNWQEDKGVIHTDDGYVYGSLVKTDGNFNSHICSFRVDPKTNKTWARSTALDTWMPAEEYVKMTCKAK